MISENSGTKWRAFPEHFSIYQIRTLLYYLLKINDVFSEIQISPLRRYLWGVPPPSTETDRNYLNPFTVPNVRSLTVFALAECEYQYKDNQPGEASTIDVQKNKLGRQHGPLACLKSSVDSQKRITKYPFFC
jgi:hypothetical protein